ncbi:MAG: cupin domain-containing protein [Planctomycetota bacterium]
MKPQNHHCVESAKLEWGATDIPGVRRKELAGSHALFQLAPGTELPADAPDKIFEAFLLEGSLANEHGTLQAGAFCVQSAEASRKAGENGCTLFLRRYADPQGATEALDRAASKEPWLPGQGGLRVKPLGEGSALVHWPAGERFVPHRHFGGEEIFVLSGTFRDEHGVYPAGTWIQSPHESAHHPFVLEETVIWVKTGHLHPGAATR